MLSANVKTASRRMVDGSSSRVLDAGVLRWVHFQANGCVYFSAIDAALILPLSLQAIYTDKG